MKVYVASSWRNEYQQEVVDALRSDGHEVYDFRYEGFSWSEVDDNWRQWSREKYRSLLIDATLGNNEIIRRGFNRDMEALKECDLCVLVLPSGRSAHLEAGYAVGAGKRMIVLLLGPLEPDLMYLMSSTPVALSIEEVIRFIHADSMSAVRWS